MADQGVRSFLPCDVGLQWNSAASCGNSQLRNKNAVPDPDARLSSVPRFRQHSLAFHENQKHSRVSSVKFRGYRLYSVRSIRTHFGLWLTPSSHFYAEPMFHSSYIRGSRLGGCTSLLTSSFSRTSYSYHSRCISYSYNIPFEPWANSRPSYCELTVIIDQGLGWLLWNTWTSQPVNWLWTVNNTTRDLVVYLNLWTVGGEPGPNHNRLPAIRMITSYGLEHSWRIRAHSA